MIRSMTGYGDAERDTPAGHLRLELKSVNHRFFNASIKTPPGFDRFERDLVEVLKAHVSRGHVSAYLALDRSRSEAAEGPGVDVERARRYKEALETVQAELGVEGPVTLAMLARFGDIFRAPDNDVTESVDADTVRDLAREAAAALLRLREAEGAKLRDDLLARLDAMLEHVDAVAARAPERLIEERDRLRQAVQELTEKVEVDEDRLAREIAYLADRWDVSEEVVRFRSHVEQFREALEADGSEPVGKKLGFLVQEMLREANTIASKANDGDITRAALALKEEIERVREQVENVE